MFGVLGWVGSFDVAEAGLWAILFFEDDSSHGYHKYHVNYVVTKQMKHDYYTMLTERRPDVYIAWMNIVSYLLFLRESFYKKIDSALFHKNAVYFLFTYFP